MNDPRSLVRLTTLFPHFLGLRLLPAGLWVAWLGWPGKATFPTPVDVGLLAVAAVATWVIDRRYRERYGRVEPARLAFGRNWALLGGVAVAAALLALGGGRLPPRTLVLGLTLVLFATGAAFALPRIASGRTLVATAILAVGIGLAWALAVPSSPTALGQTGRLFSLGLGVTLALAGWAEHRSLTRTLDRARGGDRD